MKSYQYLLSSLTNQDLLQALPTSLGVIAQYEALNIICFSFLAFILQRNAYQLGTKIRHKTVDEMWTVGF